MALLSQVEVLIYGSNGWKDKIMIVDEIPATQADLQVWYDANPNVVIDKIINIGGNFLIAHN